MRNVPDQILLRIFQPTTFYEREDVIDNIISRTKFKKIQPTPERKNPTHTAAKESKAINSDTIISCTKLDNIRPTPELKNLTHAAAKESKTIYSDPTNTFLQWQRSKDTMIYYKQRAIHAMRYGQPLIIDCDYEGLMAGRALTSYTRQITTIIHHNYLASNPFAIHLCNVSESSALFGSQNLTGADLDKEIAVVSDQCFTKVVDKQDLVILSPDAPLYMEEYDPRKVYVIGGLVDLAENPPVTVSKAEALGIECRCLPLDVFMTWEGGQNKRLTLPSVFKLLRHLSQHRDWDAAIKYALPSRYQGGKQRVDNQR
ncbi:mitochondrial ribonuclease P protein 1 homolog [Watersipora subatra]|uniref:mitochondrial ribonuclease P protein 1 homolog n=1 Tax=Watersipora subatra TaxID=2589382 RepID=UPI00355AF58F